MRRIPVILLALTAGAAAQQPELLWSYGVEYPTLPAGVSLAPLGGTNHRIAPDGSIAFLATTHTGGQVLCRSTPAGPQIICQSGTPAPGVAPGNFFAGVSAFVPLSNGHVLFRTAITSSAAVAYLDRGFGPEFCLNRADPVPDHPGLVVVQVGELTGHSGAVAIRATTGPNPTTPTGVGLWVGQPGALTLLAHTGDPAPGGGTFSTLGADVALNASGTPVFEASIFPAAGGLWSGNPLQRTLGTGDPAPGMAGLWFSTCSQPVVNAAGDIAFVAVLSDGSRSLWRRSGGVYSLVARQGQTAPGTGAQFSTFGPTDSSPTSTVLTDSGLLVFTASLVGGGVNGANNSGIWAFSPAGLRLIARTGNPAPGISGANYQRLGYSNSQITFAASNAGNIVYTADLTTGPDAVFASDPAGRAFPLIVPGPSVPFNGEMVQLMSFGLPYTSGSPASGRGTYLSAGGRSVSLYRTQVQFAPPGDHIVTHTLPPPPACYPNCDGSSVPPVLNVADFSCFLNAFTSGAPYANCDLSTSSPLLSVQDFSCFLNAFAAGCS